MKKVALFVKVRGVWRFEGFMPEWLWEISQATIVEHIEKENGPHSWNIYLLIDEPLI